MLTSILRYVSDNLLLQPTVNKNPPLDECFRSIVQHSSRMALEVICAATIINGTIHWEVNDWIRRPWELENNNLCQRQNEPTLLFANCKKVMFSFSFNSRSQISTCLLSLVLEPFLVFLICLHSGSIISSSNGITGAFSQPLFNILMLRCTLQLIFTVLR